MTIKPYRVGIVRDERFGEHKTGHFHPEHPKRLSAVFRMLARDFAGRFLEIRAEPATLQQVERVHTPAHTRRILKTADQRITSLAPDTPVSAHSYLSAWLAAGACIQGVDLLMAGRCDAFFALVRPPGHHALADKSSGFCIFNNIAIAARYAMDNHPIERILIVDWDIHHGNGLNDTFYGQKNVYYYSTHDLMLYPYSGEMTQTGVGIGAGHTMNIPIDRSFTDDDLVLLYDQTLGPVIAGYKPQLIMVAAGFDAHNDDPIGRSRFSEQVYGRITRLIMDSAASVSDPAPPLFLALEGGYEPMALANCIKSVLSALEGADLPPVPHPGAGSPAVRDLIASVRSIHRQFGVMTELQA